MSLEHAHQFVSRMKEEREFRLAVSSSKDSLSLDAYLKRQGYEFDRRELIAAMAACMAELEKTMQA